MPTQEQTTPHTRLVVMPAAWAAWWMAVPPQPLPPEQLLEPVQRQSLAALCGT